MPPIIMVKNSVAALNDAIVAGETRFEHATYGFGDRYSTVEPLPYALSIHILH